MSSKQHLGMALLLLLALTGIGGLLLVWPAYRETAWINQQVADLRARSQNYDAQAQVIVKLTEELDRITRRVDTQLKTIPDSPDIAGLIRVMSLPVDGETVLEQSFSAGEIREAVPGESLPARVQPLTVEMDARFDSVFALLRAAEAMDRLLRVASINIECERRIAGFHPLAKASIVLEAVFEPTEEDE